MAEGGQQQPAVPPPSGTGPDAAAVRATLAALVPPRAREEVLASDDAFAKLGLARFRDAALGLRGSRLYAKLQTAAPAVLHDPPGPAFDWQLATLPGAGAPIPPPPPAAQKPHPNALAAALSLPPGSHVLPEAAKGPRVPPKQQL
ncbi:hypothetical protein Rsub_01193 [Raphidocelis subcapitata]|uniref:Uncharacterized protein n=1 Tax=Raphidocelis subcapitata TaxID=307507 RepID=A0A2V0NSD4_9CHLO|nr:hypothetical protein Rsub_01193 [Raphidocelis subcapitata]|eukprot:GBF88480.1 hypothetical protein Rsub_01193 [Raphidocelis subcapitata]